MNKIPYIRLGTSYFKKVKAPTISGDFNEILVPWNLDTIKQDFGKTYVAEISKYDLSAILSIRRHNTIKYPLIMSEE